MDEDIKVGALLRYYEADEAQLDLDNPESSLFKTIQRINWLSSFVEIVVVCIASEKDCGNTGERLIEISEGKFLVLAVEGSNNKEVLNRGIEVLKMEGCNIALVISGKNVMNMSSEIVVAAKKEFRKDYKVGAIGVTIDRELNEFIEDGFFQNTSTFWRISGLQEVGSFTAKDGAEEVSVLVGMALVGYSTVLIRTDEKELELRHDGKEHHQKVVKTKGDRISKELDLSGGTRTLVQNIMKGTIMMPSQ